MSRASLWILSIYAVKVRAVKTYSEHIPDILTFSIGVSVALLDMDVSPFVCVCVCGKETGSRISVHVQWLTPPFSMSDKSMKNGMERKKKKKEKKERGRLP